MPDLTLTLATLKGRSEALKDAKATLDAAVAKVANLQATTAQDTAATVAALQGVDAVGFYSSVDQLLRLERFAGKAASVDYIKAHPTCTEAEAEEAWSLAATAATGMPLLVPVASYAALYRANLAAMGLTPDATWESQRAWIIATPKDTIMGA